MYILKFKPLRNIWSDWSSLFSVLRVLFSPSWWRLFISFSSAWKLCCISAVLWNEPLSFLQLLTLPLSLHLPQCLFSSSGASGLCWQAAMTAPLIGAGGPGGRRSALVSGQRGRAGRHICYCWQLYHELPPETLSSLSHRPSSPRWAGTQSYTCSPSSPLLSFVSQQCEIFIFFFKQWVDF